MPPFKLGSVTRIEFYKRPRGRKSSRDVICCDIVTPGETIFAHEDLPHWDELIRKLEFLGGFNVEWFSGLSQIGPEPERYVAFQRGG